MDIINRLKKGKKTESVFDALVKKKAPADPTPAKSLDADVTPLSPDTNRNPETHTAETKEPVAKQRTIRTEGMHEFDLESLGQSPDAGLRVEYRQRITNLLDEDRFDEAIDLIKEFKRRLEAKPQ